MNFLKYEHSDFIIRYQRQCSGSRCKLFFIYSTFQNKLKTHELDSCALEHLPFRIEPSGGQPVSFRSEVLPILSFSELKKHTSVVSSQLLWKTCSVFDESLPVFSSFVYRKLVIFYMMNYFLQLLKYGQDSHLG